MRFASVLLASVASLGSVAHAAECVFVPNQSICGVSLRAPLKEMTARLGAPDGSIKLSADGVGWVYGSGLLLVYSQDKLREIHAWNPRLSQKFWSEVRGRTPGASPMLSLPGVSLWDLPRVRLGQQRGLPKPVADDAFSEVRQIDGALMHFSYTPDPSEPDSPDAWEAYRLSTVVITLK